MKQRTFQTKPAFISTMEHLVYVKYPTFKIEILNEQNPFSPTNQDTLEQLLKDITNRSLVSANRTEALASGTQLVWHEVSIRQ